MTHTLKSSTFKLVALLMLAGTAEAGSFIVGPVSIGDGQTARLHVVNPEGGSVHVELLFNDGSSHTLVSSNATLSLGETKTLDIHGSDVPGGILLPIVNATMATPPSTCHPVVTLQVFEKGKKVRDGFFAKAMILARGLGSSESAAIQALRTLGKAQGLFFKSSRSGNGAPGYASSLGELAEAGLIPADFGVQDYHFELRVGLLIFEVLATPSGFPRTGDRAFFIDETGVIRFSGTCDDPAPAGTPLSN